MPRPTLSMLTLELDLPPLELRLNVSSSFFSYLPSATETALADRSFAPSLARLVLSEMTVPALAVNVTAPMPAVNR